MIAYRSYAVLIYTVLTFALLASARALQPSLGFSRDVLSSNNLARDVAATCGGVSGLQQCGSSFPSSFCCPQGSTCLQLNTTAQITATLCCPTGSDCSIISPGPCDLSSQNATLVPGSQYHSQPPTALTTCGENFCCPQGYSCQGSYCAKIALSPSPSGTATSVASSSTQTPTSTTAAGPVATSIPAESSTAGQSSSNPSSQFSASSFAAGFVPGIVVGALIVGLAIFFVLRRRKQAASTSMSEKLYRSSGQDSLRDLHPDLSARPTFHGRTISEPTANLQYQAVRTGFYHLTPPKQTASEFAIDSDKPRPLFSGSPPHHSNELAATFPAQSPNPSSNKRSSGLSFKITPLRALRKQRSMHSLRRQMSTASTQSNNTVTARNMNPLRHSSRRGDDRSRTGSTETIQVLMHTPDRRPGISQTAATATAGGPPAATTTSPRRSHSSRRRNSWSSTSTTSPEADAYMARMSHMTNSDSPTVLHFPASIPSSFAPNIPYTPSNYGAGPHSGTFPPPVIYEQDEPPSRQDLLHPPGRRPSNRDTTFSTMMARAGVAREDLVVAGLPRVPAMPANAASLQGKGRKRV